MSHVTTIDIEIRDLDALKAAVREFGAEFIEGKTTYNWYGRSVGDYPLPKGMTAEQLGKCSHVIRVPGVRYEIGVVKLPGGGYTLAYDFYGSGGIHDGQMLHQKFGDKCQKLVQHYGAAKATREAQKKGMRVQRTIGTDGSIRLSISA